MRNIQQALLFKERLPFINIIT